MGIARVHRVIGKVEPGGDWGESELCVKRCVWTESKAWGIQEMVGVRRAMTVTINKSGVMDSLE